MRDGRRGSEALHGKKGTDFNTININYQFNIRSRKLSYTQSPSATAKKRGPKCRYPPNAS